MISPNDVVEERSFSKSPRKVESLKPNANPPSSAPPLPPRDEEDGFASYQNGNGVRAANIPIIHHYDSQDEDPRLQYLSSCGFRGDPSWRPNTGETNVYDTAVFGLALHELLDYLRLANICCGLASILLLAAGFLFRLVLLRLDKLVLSSYLGFLAVTLLLSELLSLWRVESLDHQLRDNFGLIYHPPGKVVFIYVLATLCWAIGGLGEVLLGWIYFGSASILLYVWMSYPEYRRLFDASLMIGSRSPQPRSNSWSYFSNSLASFSKVTNETVGLLDVVVRQQQQRSGPI